jgi:hypothetical protein
MRAQGRVAGSDEDEDEDEDEGEDDGGRRLHHP